MLLASGFATCEKERLETNNNSNNNRIGMDLSSLERDKNSNKDRGALSKPHFQFINS
jgi:hypothetical protein